MAVALVLVLVLALVLALVLQSLESLEPLHGNARSSPIRAAL